MTTTGFSNLSLMSFFEQHSADQYNGMNFYPTAQPWLTLQFLVKLQLPPDKFPTEGERDTYFEAVKTDINGRYDKLVTRAKETCPENNPDQCASDTSKLEEKRKKELAVVETQRQAVKIG